MLCRFVILFAVRLYSCRKFRPLLFPAFWKIDVRAHKSRIGEYADLFVLCLRERFNNRRHVMQYFTQYSVMGASLQYIGRRTLDIYLIHYLFLPDLPTIGEFFDKYRHNFVLDTLATIVIALLVIGFCIITSNILRVSPFFRKWLFGRS